MLPSHEPQNNGNQLDSIDSGELFKSNVFEEDNLAQWQGENFLNSDGFAEMETRRSRVEKLLQHKEDSQNEGLSDFLTMIMDDWVDLSHIDGMMIATSDGLMVAQTTEGKAKENMAAIAALFEGFASRIQCGSIVDEVSELSLRGSKGELIVISHFENLQHDFFLITYASKQVDHWFINKRVLKECGVLLAKHFGNNRY